MILVESHRFERRLLNFRSSKRTSYTRDPKWYQAYYLPYYFARCHYTETSEVRNQTGSFTQPFIALSQCDTFSLWGGRELNSRRRALQARALPAELPPQMQVIRNPITQRGLSINDQLQHPLCEHRCQRPIQWPCWGVLVFSPSKVSSCKSYRFIIQWVSPLYVVY